MTKPREIRLSTTPTPEALAELRLGDIVYLDGLLYTAREGVYMRALEEKANIPMELPSESAANFHCSPAAAIRSDGSFDMGAVTATASFRFAKWLPEWMEKDRRAPHHRQGRHVVEGLQGVFRPQRRDLPVDRGLWHRRAAGRGIEKVEAVHWRDELGLAQAMWVIRCSDRQRRGRKNRA